MNAQSIELAIEEIKSLREQNSYLRARLQMFDDMMMLFKARQPEYGMAKMPDIVKDLQQELYNQTAPNMTGAKNPIIQNAS